MHLKIAKKQILKNSWDFICTGNLNSHKTKTFASIHYVIIDILIFQRSKLIHRDLKWLWKSQLFVGRWEWKQCLKKTVSIEVDVFKACYVYALTFDWNIEGFPCAYLSVTNVHLWRNCKFTAWFCYKIKLGKKKRKLHSKMDNRGCPPLWT